MSIIVKGMKMPKEGRLLVSIHSDGCVYQSVYDMGFEKVNQAVATELPPHGRIIDADALHYSRIRMCHEDGTVGGYNAVVMSAEIKDAPTIIDVEEVEQ